MDVIDTVYQLTSQSLIELLCDLSFYEACPHYLFLEDVANARCQAYRSEVAAERRKPCNGCGDKSRNYIQPLLIAFLKHTQKLFEQNPALLDPLREHLALKLGYRPSKYVLYYRDRGKRTKLMF